MSVSVEIKNSIYNTSSAHLNAKYAVNSNTERDELITKKKISVGHFIIHYGENKIYRLKEYPNEGILVGVVWEEIKKSLSAGDVNTWVRQQHYEINRINSAINVVVNLDASLYHEIDLGHNTTIDVDPLTIRGGSEHLFKITNATPGYTVAWSDKFVFENDTPMVAGTGNGEINIYRFYCDGTKLICIDAKKNYNYTQISQTLGTPQISNIAEYNGAFIGVTITFGGIAGAINYEIQYREIGDVNWINASENPVVTTSPNIDVAYGNLEFRVRAFDGTNYSLYSAISSFTLTPRAPTGLAVTSSVEFLNVNWNAVEDAEGYVVDYKLNSDSTWSVLGFSNTNSLVIDRGIITIPSSTHNFRVRTSSNGLFSVYSGIVNHTLV